MATISELLSRDAGAVVVRTCAPGAFHFAESGDRCSYWSNGAHIVVCGICRCGRRFILCEQEPGDKHE